MKILQVFCRYLEPGGEEAAVKMISDLLSGNHSVKDVFFHNRTLQSSNWLQRLKRGALFFHNPSSRRLYQEARQAFQPDVVVVHNLFPAGSGSLLLEILKGPHPVIYVAHNFRPYSVNGYCWADGRIEPAGLKLNFIPEIVNGSWQSSRSRTLVFALVLYWLHVVGAWRRISAWITVSHFMKDTLSSAGVPPDKIHSLPLPFHGPDSRHGREKVPDSVQSKEPVFLFMGRLCQEKGVFVLLEAWRQYLLVGGTGQLIIAGSGPLAQFPISPWEGMAGVSFAGQITGEKKEEILAGCTALLVPSVWWEPFGLVVYDAFRHAKPVLAADSGGLRETVHHGATGWVHVPGDADQLCGHLMDAAQHPEKARMMGIQGFNTLKDHSPAAWVKGFEEVCASLGVKSSQQ